MAFSIDPPADGPTNMARDIELLRKAEEGQPGARIYSWDELWVTLGRFQTPEEALKRPVPYVIRPTGGSAVLHGHDLTVAIAIPHAGARRSVRAIYRTLVSPVVEALRQCGLNARLAEDTAHAGTGTRSADCFAFASTNDVVDELTGAKVCGCALRVTNRAALLQASIPYREPIMATERILHGGVALPITPWRYEGFAQALNGSLGRVDSAALEAARPFLDPAEGKLSEAEFGRASSTNPQF
jgi:lipoate-protein ligase A